MKVAILGGTGSFGRALAATLVALGDDEVVIGSRDAERAQAAAAELGGGATGAANADAVRGVDLAVLAVKADAALETARDVAGCARHDAAPLRRERDRASSEGRGMLPDPDARSLAERVQDVVAAPVAAGLHSIAAASLDGERPDEDALVCGDDERAKELVARARGPARRGRALDAGPLASARALEGMTAVIVNLNRRYKAHAGVRVTGIDAMISLIPVRGLPEIRAGDDLAALVVELHRARASDDVVVLAQKAVSKAEGRVVRIDGSRRRRKAIELAGDERDPREVEVILREAKRIVRERGPLVIAETTHGFVCASAGRRPLERARAGNARAAAGRSRRERARASRPAARADRARRRRRRHRLVRPAVPAGDDRRRDRRRRDARRSSICAARPTGSATSCARAGSRSPTRSPAAADLARGKAEGVPVVVVRGLGSRVTARRRRS